MNQLIGNLELIGLLIATVVGAIISSFLGWQDSVDNSATPNPFKWSKFWPSIVRAIISALTIFGATYSGYVGGVTIFTYILAFLAGAGIDSAGNKISGVLQKPSS